MPAEADQGDPHAEPQVVKYVSQGDTVKLKSTGRSATVLRKLDDSTSKYPWAP